MGSPWKPRGNPTINECGCTSDEKVTKMNDGKKLKILLLGPVSTGKTAIANFLSDSTENSTGDYRPTKGVRIVEFEAQGVKTKGFFKKNVEVELWDCSGDNRYQSCWPAMRHEADGLVFVYTETSNQQRSALKLMYNFFVEEINFPENCCFVVRHEAYEENLRKISENPLGELSHGVVNLETRGDEFKKYFNSFLSAVLKSGLNE